MSEERKPNSYWWCRCHSGWIRKILASRKDSSSSKIVWRRGAR